MPFDPVSFSEALKALRKQPQATQPKYIVYQDGGKYCAQNGFTNAVEKCDSDASTVINYALSNLTPGRTWKETVVLRGTFTLSNPIVLYSFTRLVIDGVINVLTQDYLYAVIINYANSLLAPPGYNIPDTDIEVVGGVIKGCGASGNPPTCPYGSEYGIYFGTVNNFKIAGVTVSGFPWDGIIINGASNGIVSDNVVTDVGGGGIVIEGDKIVVSNNIISPNSPYPGWGTGIYASGLSNAVVDGNIIYNASSEGILVEGSSYVTVSSNIVFLNGTGISVVDSNNVVVSGNVVYNNNDTGILIGYRYFTVKNNVIIGNFVSDDRSPAKQKYGILFAILTLLYIPEYFNNNLVACNHVFGNTIEQIAIPVNSLANNFVFDNVGYTTEDHGSVTLPAGNTSVTVQTNLSAPIKSVVITPDGEPPGKLWVTIGSDGKSFTVNTDVAPSIDLVIYYQVKGARR
jgi:parallel beta-helix repeat protein